MVLRMNWAQHAAEPTAEGNSQYILTKGMWSPLAGGAGVRRSSSLKQCGAIALVYLVFLFVIVI